MAMCLLTNCDHVSAHKPWSYVNLLNHPPIAMCSQVLLATISPFLRSSLPSTGWSRARQWPAPGRLWAATVEGPGHQYHCSGGGAARHAWRKGNRWFWREYLSPRTRMGQLSQSPSSSSLSYGKSRLWSDQEIPLPAVKDPRLSFKSQNCLKMNREAGCLVRKPAGGQQHPALPTGMIFVVGREWEVWVYREMETSETRRRCLVKPPCTAILQQSQNSLQG